MVNAANAGDILGSGCGVSRSASASRHRALPASPAIDVNPLPGRLARLSARPDTLIQQAPRHHTGEVVDEYYSYRPLRLALRPTQRCLGQPGGFGGLAVLSPI